MHSVDADNNVDADSPEAPLADYRQHYGLSEDPFREGPDFPFFGGGGRRALLDQLQHLCQFTASLLAVLGKPGTGKTRLAKELAQSFEPEDEICLLKARPGAGADDILGQMVRHFALPLDEDSPSVGRLLAALRHFAQMADEQDRLALTIIDDAHHLDEKTLGALISLLQGQEESGRRLHIVLFADLDMINRLDQFNMHDVLIHDFELIPFSLDEATDYLNFRMEMSDYMGPEVFTEARVEPWWRRAEGRLAPLHQSARQWLLESVSPGRDKKRAPLPVAHIVVVAALLSVLLMVFVYSGDSEPEGEGEDGAAATRLSERRETQSLDISRNRENNESPVGTAAEPEPRIDIEPEPLLSEAIKDESEPESGEPERKTATEPESTDEGLADESRRPVAESETETEVEPEPQTLPDVPEDEQVLLSWRESEYTLQLLGASSEGSVRDYIERQPNSDDLLFFETRRQGEPWFVVVTGRFGNSDQARAARAQLPSAQREAGPWPRSLAELQEEIEQFRELD